MTLKVGDKHEFVVIENVSRTHTVKYAGASGDFNPLHHDDGLANSLGGYPTIFAHGMLSMGLTGRMLTDWLGATNLKKFGVRLDAETEVMTCLGSKEGFSHMCLALMGPGDTAIVPAPYFPVHTYACLLYTSRCV